MNNENKVVIGVDVGSGSVRAGIFNLEGGLLTRAVQNINVFRRSGSRVEQSSTEIWLAICHCIKQSLEETRTRPENVVGLGFDATCSLVVVGENGRPLATSADGNADQNIIVWMDHRATAQAERINATRHPVLKYVGGKISPEMETPKILWLKENRREIYDNVWQFFDLADYLTWRATGDLTRSMCTVTCKWTWLAHENRWDPDYFRTIGLEDLADENFRRIGQKIVAPGTPCGRGLTDEAAREMGLLVGTPVAIGIIDAHAGGIGTVGVGDGALSNLAYVFGTSSCTMTSTQEAIAVPGVWGPYYSAMVPGYWLNEGGQSSTGAAIDQLVAMHPAGAEAAVMAEKTGVSLPVFLANLAQNKSATASAAVELAAGIYIVPEFLGNRAPFADPDARAVITGLGMERDLDSLVAIYIAALCGIGYGLRQIIDAQHAQGIKTESIVISGGAGYHPLVRQILADACDLPVISTKCSEPVLLGSAILGAVAAGIVPSVVSAMKQFSHKDRVYSVSETYRTTHQRHYENYQRLQQTVRMLQE
ncbi:TPA: FGGY-family carbohydrate kinase [Salmonella enterica subsp. enterica serovar Eastbourne]|uniref:Ribulokinase n=1 Tax=Salmonella enterica subsp. enterica serovar Eastbourne TaxID=486993 RepID=A0A702BAC1_SALET|nr:ribulokinase [Salmonella enterica subsp. enterica serovar Eastbourne]HAC6678936.1 ribulokinase [Salmonella enterica subsp. enterica serovar Eastbourne]HAE5116426.1 FGGY-family carbohydrate kinase [Salmonella enterica subsp. enterica serovar Eastbourne]HAE8030827.1 FGGY-family carbohydrate kinase [Salmonella enterica subsp. enterica serovar Eastbourne]HDN7459925.1 FGGY-family carbohydrate kinase [Salmonella enterica subsp. enterica serovar Eastbourne]